MSKSIGRDRCSGTLGKLGIAVTVLLVGCSATLAETGTETAGDVVAAAGDDGRGEFMIGGPPSLEGPLAYSGQIQPIFNYYCTPCHKGTTPTGCVCGTCFVSFSESLTLPAYNLICPDLNKAECALARIRNSLPDSGLPDHDKLIGPLDARIVMHVDSLDVWQRWVDAGMPG